MKKKGFTLIELLAVIVILAIIALVAVPIILNMIDKAKKQAAIDSAYGYVEAVEYNNGLADLGTEGYTKIADGEYETSEIDVKMKGKKPQDGTLTLEKSKVTEGEFIISGYEVLYDGKIAIAQGKAQNINPSLVISGLQVQARAKSANIIFAVSGNPSSVKCYYGDGYSNSVTATTVENGYQCSLSSLSMNTKYKYRIVAENSNGSNYQKGSFTTGDLGQLTYSTSPAMSEWAATRTVTLSGTNVNGTIEYALIDKDDVVEESDFTTYTTPVQITTNGKTLYGRIKDGEDTTEAITYTEEKIDNVVIPTPTATVECGYPIMKNTGGYDNKELTITYTAQEGTSAYYSLDNGSTWVKYNGKTTVSATNVKVKLVRDLSRREGSVVTATVTCNLPADAMPADAYNGNGYVVPVTNSSSGGSLVIKKMDIDPSLRGKKLYVNITMTTNYASWAKEGYIKFYNSSGEEITDAKYTLRRNFNTKAYVDIPSNAVRFSISYVDGCTGINIIEIEPDFNITISANTDTKEVTINYPDELASKLYKINNGSWQTYNGKIHYSAGDSIYAKGVKHNNKDTRIVSFDDVKPNLDSEDPHNIIEPVAGNYGSCSATSSNLSTAFEFLINGNLTKECNYGAYLSNGSVYLTFKIKENVYMSFTSGYYSDSGGSNDSGTAIFYYIDSSSNTEELYATVTTKSNTQNYGKTFFKKGTYKLVAAAAYTEFDEFTFSSSAS